MNPKLYDRKASCRREESAGCGRGGAVVPFPWCSEPTRMWKRLCHRTGTIEAGKSKKPLSLGTLFLLVMKISRIWVVESFYLLGFSGGMFFLNQDLGEKEVTYLHF